MGLAAEKPNILLIVADDLGYADVGFNGGEIIKTPNLDRLAAGGINLTDFRACPMCSPTRAGLMTGKWPLRFGMMRSVVPPWSTNGLPASEKTIADCLAANGYERRGIVGKWHLGQSRAEFLPLAHGFTSFYGHYNGAIDYFTHKREGEVDWHRDARSIHEEGYSTDLLGDEAARFVHESPAGKPWFLYLPFNAPHAPYEAKPADLKKYERLKLPDRRAYAAMVDCMDQAIGRVLAAVDARPDATNTLVLFFSDNGGIPKVGSSNHPYRGAKLTVYEGGTRVCACIRWPAGGLSGGGKFDGRVGYIDVLPTVLAAAGISCDTKPDGINFLPALRGQGSLPDRPWFSYVHQDETAHASVNEGQWKLVADGDFFSEKPATPPVYELYDLSSDPGEKTNCISSRLSVARDLEKKLRDFGKLRSNDAGGYSAGREGFHAPKDWLITSPTPAGGKASESR
jgi:arylsulfatase A-like enzyme